MLRESTRPLELWCSDAAYADLTRGNPVLTVLDHYCGIERHALPDTEEAFTVAGIADRSAMPATVKAVSWASAWRSMPQ